MDTVDRYILIYFFEILTITLYLKLISINDCHGYIFYEYVVMDIYEKHILEFSIRKTT